MKFTLNRLSSEQNAELEKLIDDLNSKTVNNAFCDELRNVQKDGVISFETFYTLSKWCHTNDNRRKNANVFKEISNLLFGQIVPRPSNSKFNSIEICMM